MWFYPDPPRVSRADVSRRGKNAGWQYDGTTSLSVSPAVREGDLGRAVLLLVLIALIGHWMDTAVVFADSREISRVRPPPPALPMKYVAAVVHLASWNGCGVPDLNYLLERFGSGFQSGGGDGRGWG